MGHGQRSDIGALPVVFPRSRPRAPCRRAAVPRTLRRSRAVEPTAVDAQRKAYAALDLVGGESAARSLASLVMRGAARRTSSRGSTRPAHSRWASWRRDGRCSYNEVQTGRPPSYRPACPRLSPRRGSSAVSRTRGKRCPTRGWSRRCGPSCARSGCRTRRRMNCIRRMVRRSPEFEYGPWSMMPSASSAVILPSESAAILIFTNPGERFPVYVMPGTCCRPAKRLAAGGQAGHAEERLHRRAELIAERYRRPGSARCAASRVRCRYRGRPSRGAGGCRCSWNGWSGSLIRPCRPGRSPARW